MRGIVIAGTASGVGKTTVALGLMGVLQKRGLKVQPFKVGPDFIDPGHHTRVCGRPSRNLDTWMLSNSRVQEVYWRHAGSSDLSVVEGVMGLFDGLGGKSEQGSTAQIAKLLNLPVILVVDTQSMARSVGAIVYGFEQYDPGISLAGVIFNRVGSSKHYEYLREAVSERCKAKVLGYLPRDERLVLPQRHLGLVTAKELGPAEGFMLNLKSHMESTVNIDEIISLSGTKHPLSVRDGSFRDPTDSVADPAPSHSRPRLAVAMDEAFSFYYQDNLDLLAALGVDVCPFSPIQDLFLPEDADGIYLGGGYPELYAPQLSANNQMRNQIREAAQAGCPIYAECGGLMYLSRCIRDAEGRTYEMVGLFDTEARMLKKRRALGYVEARLSRDCLVGRKGWILRGHEYHYSELVSDPLEQGAESVYELVSPKAPATRREGYSYRNVLASYVHLHFGSNDQVAGHFADCLRKSREQRLR